MQPGVGGFRTPNIFDTPGIMDEEVDDDLLDEEDKVTPVAKAPRKKKRGGGV